MKALLSTLKPFLVFFAAHWKPMAAGTGLGLMAIAATVGLLALSGWFLSATAFAGLTPLAAQAFNYFFPSVGLRLCAITRTVARYGERILSHDATFRLLESLRVWFYQKLEPLAPARLMHYRSGDILNRIVSDIDALDNLYLRVLSPTIVAMMLSLMLTVFLWMFAPFVAMSSFLALLVAGFIVPSVAAAVAAGTGRQLARSVSRLREKIVEGLQGLPEMLVFGRNHAYIEDLQAQNSLLVAIQRRMSHIRGATSGFIVMIAGLAVLVALHHGAGRVNRGDLGGANLALVALAVLAAFDAVILLPSAYQYLGRTYAAGRRLMAVVGVAPAVSYPPRSSVRLRHFDVRFEKVCFSYGESGNHVLSDIDLLLGAGERVAVLGQTGAGKSTLAHLMVRFWDPTSGHILIGGEDIRNLSETDLRQTISVVSQQPHLFNASIRDNLLLAKPRATAQALWQALETVGLADFVGDLPGGLDNWIGEAGKLVSGGQARRLALARAVLHDAPIWILDEPTEGLDRVTERKILERIFELSKGKTLLYITHRLLALDRMDTVVVLEQGHIVEAGSHARLRQNSARYRAMLRRVF